MSNTQPPTPKQLRFLRELALERGQSFTYPTTRSQASSEIRRLRAERRQTRVDRAIERRQLAQALPAGDASRVEDREIIGYGSSARWARKRESLS